MGSTVVGGLGQYVVANEREHLGSRSEGRGPAREVVDAYAEVGVGWGEPLGLEGLVFQPVADLGEQVGVFAVAGPGECGVGGAELIVAKS